MNRIFDLKLKSLSDGNLILTGEDISIDEKQFEFLLSNAMNKEKKTKYSNFTVRRITVPIELGTKINDEKNRYSVNILGLALIKGVDYPVEIDIRYIDVIIDNQKYDHENGVCELNNVLFQNNSFSKYSFQTSE